MSRMVSGWLVVTQVMDERDSNLGFFVTWVRGLARLEIAPLHVVCWRADAGLSIPGVIVHILPRGVFARVWALIRLSWQLRGQIGSVFVHMVPPVVVALGWWWRILGFRIALWYTHGTVSWSLRVAESFVHHIFTASEESCRLHTAKKMVVGHGIDLDFFRPDSTVLREPILLMAGRITPRKNLKTFIDVCGLLRARTPAPSFRAVIAGEPRTEGDRVYEQEMRAYARAQGLEEIIEWAGPLSAQALRTRYQQAAAFVTTSQTGSLDKVVLEALACGLPVVAQRSTYAQVGGVASFDRVEDMARSVGLLLSAKTSHHDGRLWVEGHADLASLLNRIRLCLMSPII